MFELEYGNIFFFFRMAETDPKVETGNEPVIVDQSGDSKSEVTVIEVPKDQMIQLDQSPEAQLMAKMDELKVAPEDEIPRPKLSQLFLAFSKLSFDEGNFSFFKEFTSFSA